MGRVGRASISFSKKQARGRGRAGAPLSLEFLANMTIALPTKDFAQVNQQTDSGQDRGAERGAAVGGAEEKERGLRGVKSQEPPAYVWP